MNRFVQQARQLWESLALRQRLSLLGAVAVLGVAFVLLLRHQSEQNFKPLFQNVSSEDAGVVLTRLRESGIEFRLADGGSTIKVPAGKIDETRIQLAAEGLPKSGRIGFELFDKANFGASEFTEQVNYHRAVEGELERSVLALQEVEQARVHITFARNSIFLERREPAKASVMVKLRPGIKLSAQNLLAITHLTASAVEGLSPDQVSVLDMHGNLLSKPRRHDPNASEPSETLLAYRAGLEKDLLLKVRDLLDPLLGPERYRASVSLDCDLASGDQSEETFDPSRSVMSTAQRTEDGAAPAAANGVPGTPSSLPRPTSRPGSGSSGAFRRTESTTFQTSRVVRRTQFPQGQVKRMSVSLLLDHATRFEGQKKIVEAPSPQQMKSIRDIVAAVVGFQEARGDVLTVEALPFSASTLQEPSAAAPPGVSGVQLPESLPLWLRTPLERHLRDLLETSWLPVAILIVALLLLFLPILALRKLLRLFSGKKTAVPIPALPPVAAAAAAAQSAAGSRTPASAVHSEGLPRLDLPGDADSEESARITREKIQNLKAGDGSRFDALKNYVTDEGKKEPEKMARIVRAWLREAD